MMNDNRLRAIAALVLLNIVVWAFALAPTGRTLNVTVMDVGEGLCIVMRSPSGKTIIVDCGTCSWRNNETVGESVVLPYLKEMGVQKIDIAVISHPHEDHISGMKGLLDACPPTMILGIKCSEQSSAYRDLIAEIRSSGGKYRVAKRGQTISLDDGVVIQVLNPSADDYGQDLNDESIVLRVVYEKTAFLLAADIGSDTEFEILNEDMPIRAQVLQVGHHGSRGSASAGWLAAVQPDAAVISCGRNNSYGHPAVETLDRLNDCGARIYRTDKNGAVSFYSDGKTIRIATMVSK